jgi:hypothetical protein
MSGIESASTRRRLGRLKPPAVIRLAAIGLLLVVAACGPSVPTPTVTPSLTANPTPTAAPATLSVTGAGAPGCSEAPGSGCLLSFLIRSGDWNPAGPVASRADDGSFLVLHAAPFEGPWRITGPTRGVPASVAPGRYVFGAATTMLSDVIEPGFSGPVHYDFLGCYQPVTVAPYAVQVQVEVTFSGRTCVMTIVVK